MKNRTWMLLPAALLAATGCNSNADRSRDDEARTQREARDEDRSAGTDADAPAPADSPEPGEALVGRWSQDEDCGRVLEMRADGTLTAFDGVEGTWSTRGEGEDMILTMRRPGQVADLHVSSLTQDGFRMSDGADQGGDTFDMKRCT